MLEIEEAARSRSLQGLQGWALPRLAAPAFLSACGSATPISASVFTWTSLLWVCVFSFSISYEDDLSLDLGPTLTREDLIQDLHLNYICKGPYFKWESHSGMLRRPFNPVHRLIPSPWVPRFSQNLISMIFSISFLFWLDWFCLN